MRKCYGSKKALKHKLRAYGSPKVVPMLLLAHPLKLPTGQFFNALPYELAYHTGTVSHITAALEQM